MKNLRKNHKIKQIGIPGLSLIMMIILGLALSISAQSADSGYNLSHLESELEQSRYSAFQNRMIITATKELLDLGADFEDLNKVLISSIANNFDGYNIKKVLEVFIDARKSGISERPLMNKFKEGLAKNVGEWLIVNVLLEEAENLKFASNLVKDHLGGTVSHEQHEMMLQSLAEGLNNGVPRESLSEVFSRSAREGRSIREVAEVSTELGNLSLRAYELGFSEEEVNEVFQRAIMSRSGVDGICEDIQDMLIATAITRMNMSSRKGPSGTDESPLPSDADSGDTGTGIIVPPGSGVSPSPTDADDKPDSPSKPDSDSSSPPEN